MYVTLGEDAGSGLRVTVKERAGRCGLPPKSERDETQQALGSGAFCREPEEKLSWEMKREGKRGSEGRGKKGVWRVRVRARECVCVCARAGAHAHACVLALSCQLWLSLGFLFCRFLA